MSGEATGWVWRYSPMKKSGLLVHLALADVANDMHGNQLWCSIDTIVRKTRVARSVVIEVFDRLVAQGLLAVEQERPGRTTLYRFRFPELPVQFSDGLRETPVQNPDGGVQKPDGTRPETGPELKITKADNPAAASLSEGQCTEWVPIDATNLTVTRCALLAGHEGLCEPRRHVELEHRERKDVDA